MVATDASVAPTLAALVAVTETSAGLVSATIQPLGGVPAPYLGTAQVNAIHGATITFNNFVAPPTGNNGCTPGFWKQDQHFDSWPAAYTQTTSFNAAFGIGTNWFPNTFTLLDALQNGGGGVNALGRQATAALLNAAKGFYPLTTAQVIADVKAAYANSSLIESTKDLLEADNTLGCPLN